MEGDRDYFLKRALEEDEAAQAATCPQAKRRHEELAVAYRRRTLGVEARDDAGRE